MKSISFITIVFTLNSICLKAAIADLSSALGLGGRETKVLLTEQEAREELHAKLVHQLQEHKQGGQELSVLFRAELKQIKADDIRAMEQKAESKDDSEREFAEKKLSFLNEQNQVVKQTSTVFDAIEDVLSRHIALLDMYLTDPSLDSFKRDLLRSKGFYSFEDIKGLYRAKLSKQEEIESLNSKQKVFQAEIDTRKRRLDRIKQDHAVLLEQRDEIIEVAQDDLQNDKIKSQ